MASKVMVKIPVAPFAKVNKSTPNGVTSELVIAPRPELRPDPVQDAPKEHPTPGRVTQLQQNIRFLQEQHHQMLTGLHKEIDGLRHRNRDLQFQLVFAKGTLPSSPSSPEDDTKPKVYSSPKQVNITPLQVEILEKELGELKIQIQDIESRNAYLSAIVEEQKRKLERYERDREREIERATQTDPKLLRKLEDAEVTIRRLRQENSELRNQNSSYHQREYVSFQRNGTAQNRSNGRNRGTSGGHYRDNWFPPVHGHTYWPSTRSLDKNGGATSSDATTLPSLAPSASGSSSQYQGRKGANNNQYNGENRKYRSAQNRNSHKPS